MHAFFTISGHELDIWDKIHFNDASKEAYFSFPFAIEIYFISHAHTYMFIKNKKRNIEKTTV